MQQQPLSPVDGSFGARLALLRQSLGEADPLAALAPLTPATVELDDTPRALAAAGATRDADALAAAFHAAAPDAQAAYLLRALDDAIVALDLSAQLADEFTLTPGVPLTPSPSVAAASVDQPTPTGKPKKKHKSAPPQPAAPPDPLHEAYRAFVASQPALQALYHYRNALATRLRLATRDLPLVVAGDDVGAAAEDEGVVDE